jgi:phage shock protein C
MNSPKRLYRSRDNRMIGGVCGGLAEYFNIDPTLVRLVFLILFLAAGSGPLLYLVMWVIVPEA